MQKVWKFLAAFSLLAGVSVRALGEEKPESYGFGMPISGSYGIGSLGLSTRDIPQRRMTALSVEALPGYQFGDWLVGAHLDFTKAWQQTPINDAGGTNWRGSGWRAGIGGQYFLTPTFALQATLDLAGKYSFERSSPAEQSIALGRPLAISFNAQFFLCDQTPMSFDINARYLTYREFQVSSTSYSETSRGYIIGVGASWHFGGHGTSAN